MLQHFGQLVFILIALASIGDYLRDTLEVPNRFLDSLVRASILQYTYLDCRHGTVHQRKHPLLVRSMCCMHLISSNISVFISVSMSNGSHRCMIRTGTRIYQSGVVLYCTHSFTRTDQSWLPIVKSAQHVLTQQMYGFARSPSVCQPILYDKDLK